jgi:hypothetical protein
MEDIMQVKLVGNGVVYSTNDENFKIVDVKEEEFCTVFKLYDYIINHVFTAQTKSNKPKDENLIGGDVDILYNECIILDSEDTP